MTENTLSIEGGCHCGIVHYLLELPVPAGKIAVRACGCGFCRMHGGVYTSHPRGRLDVTIADGTKVNKYRFGTGTADFYVCRCCGVTPVVTSEIDGRLYAVVNVNTFADADRPDFDESVSDFDGETTENRLQRRARVWISQVTVTERAAEGS